MSLRLRWAKKGDRSLACNYRPVSLTCVPCKLLEHIVCSNIMAHLDEHKHLSDRHHAFRKRHSCETQFITVINDWAKILDDGGQVDLFILDFEKAFDTPPHELLKCKLYGYGIGGKTLKWIDSFLCFRQQRVVVNGIKSDRTPVLSGVPLGTVLGPLLFSLYINDITTHTDSEIVGSPFRLSLRIRSKVKWVQHENFAVEFITSKQLVIQILL